MAHLRETSFCVIGIALLCMNLAKRLRSLLRHFLRIWFLSAPSPVFAFLGLTERTLFRCFEEWITAIKNSKPSSEIVVKYDFDREIIDIEDSFYIDSVEHTWSDGHTKLN